MLALVCAAGCASPSEPVTRHPPIANPIADLSAHQVGSRVFLTFSLPAKTTDHKGITVTPSLEVHWAFLSAGTLAATAAAIEKQGASVVRVPSAMVEQYKSEDHVRLPVELKTEDVEHHFGAVAAFAVRTKISEKGISDSSNVSVTRIYPAAAPISDLAAKVTEKAVELSWTAATLPALPSNASSASPTVTYHVYRDERHEMKAAPAAAAPETPSELLGESTSPGYRDTTFEFGHAYIYSVRSLVQYGSTPADSVESGDSNVIVLTPKDIFPPAAPAGLVAIPVPATPDVPAHIELSWAISPETDLSGYNIYRSEQGSTPVPRLNQSTLLAPSYRDMTVIPGRLYTYTVTAIDRAGNESPASEPVTAGISLAEKDSNP
jgi:hypothetical protein